MASMILGFAAVIGLGALVVAFMSTDAGDACCSGTAAILLLFGVGAMFLFLLLIGGVTCSAVFA